MRLIYKVVFLFLLLSLLVFAIGGVLSYRIMKNEVDLEQRLELMSQLRYVEGALAKGTDTKALVFERLAIRPLGPGDSTMYQSAVVFSDTLVKHPRFERMENNRKLVAMRYIGGKWYHISLFGQMVEVR